MSAFVERQAAHTAARRRREEDLAIAVGMMMRLPAIDDLLRSLYAAGGSPRLVKALKAELARRRGGRR